MQFRFDNFGKLRNSHLFNPMEQILLFILYTSVLLGILYYYSKKEKAMLNFSQLSIAFIAKIIAGCAYGYLFLNLYKGDDTWKLHQAGLAEFQLLIQSPAQFFISIFQYGYQENQTMSFFTAHHSYWKDLADNILIKLLAIFNIFSRGSYYINVLFFNFLIFWGHYFLYKLFIKQYENNSRLLFLIVFFFPPLLFWESGIRKDGLVFLMLMGFLFHFYSFLKTETKKHIFYALIFWLGLFIFRNFVAMLAIAVALLWRISHSFPKKTAFIFIVVILLMIALFFASSLLFNDLNLPMQMAKRQESFQNLSGGSRLPLQQLEPNFKSYTSILPVAINHSFLRPYPTEISNPLYLMAFIETILVLAMLIFVLLFNKKFFPELFQNPFLLGLVLFALLNYVLIGYMVPFLGAIIRYKVIYETLLILVLLKWFKLKHYTIL